MRSSHIPRLLDLLRADLARSGAMDEMLRHFAATFDVASASIAIPGESFAFEVPEGFSDAYPAAQDPTQTFLAHQAGGVFCLGRSFKKDSDVLFDVASNFGINDAAVGNVDVLGSHRMKLILLGERTFNDTDQTVLQGLAVTLARALSARERVSRPDAPYLVVLSRTGDIRVSRAAEKFLAARFAGSRKVGGPLMQALSEATAMLVRSGRRTRVFAQGVAISCEADPSDPTRVLLLLHDAAPLENSHPAEWLLTVRQRQVARSAAAGATTRAIAEELSISADTVKEHLAMVYERLGVGSRGELMVLLAS